MPPSSEASADRGQRACIAQPQANRAKNWNGEIAGWWRTLEKGIGQPHVGDSGGWFHVYDEAEFAGSATLSAATPAEANQDGMPEALISSMAATVRWNAGFGKAPLALSE